MNYFCFRFEINVFFPNFKLSTHISPVCLPVPTEEFELRNQDVTIVGEGYVDEVGLKPMTPKELNLTVSLVMFPSVKNIK